MSERKSPLRTVRDGWLRIVACFAEAQTLTLLGVIYAFVIGPASLISRIVGSDFLSKRGLGAGGSAWREADTRAPVLENVKQPF